MYVSVKTALLSRRFCPGNRLTEQHVAALLGVSRTPVREALQRLAVEGLLIPRPRRGFTVPPESPTERDGLLELWGAYQGYALRAICQHATPALLRNLETIVRKAADALAQEDRTAVLEWRQQFHACLWTGLADQPRLTQHIHDLEQALLPYCVTALRGRDAAQPALLTHQGILLALELRDGELCKRLMRAHGSRLDALVCVAGIQELRPPWTRATTETVNHHRR